MLSVLSQVAVQSCDVVGVSNPPFVLRMASMLAQEREPNETEILQR